MVNCYQRLRFNGATNGARRMMTAQPPFFVRFEEQDKFQIPLSPLGKMASQPSFLDYNQKYHLLGGSYALYVQAKRSLFQADRF